MLRHCLLLLLCTAPLSVSAADEEKAIRAIFERAARAEAAKDYEGLFRCFSRDGQNELLASTIMVWGYRRESWPRQVESYLADHEMDGDLNVAFVEGGRDRPGLYARLVRYYIQNRARKPVPPWLYGPLKIEQISGDEARARIQGGRLPMLFVKEAGSWRLHIEPRSRRPFPAPVDRPLSLPWRWIGAVLGAGLIAAAALRVLAKREQTNPYRFE